MRITNCLPRLPSKSIQTQSTGGTSSLLARLDRILTARHVLYVFVAFMAWLTDSFNIFVVSLSLKRLSVQYGIGSLEELSLALSLTHLFRSAGAFVFGLMADRFGRRWLLTLNMLGMSGTVLGTTFILDYSDFLVVRGLFAFFLGGTYGTAVALALENLPTHTLGFVSGFFQHGYYLGYFLAGGFDMNVVTPLNNWRVSFYAGSGLSFLTAAICVMCPDSEIYIQLRQGERLYPDPHRPSMGRSFLRSLRAAISNHWRRTIYCVLLLTAFHSISRISQDSYQKFAIVNKKMSVENTALLGMIGIGGSMIGTIVGGWLSQCLGRRITIIMMCTFAGAFVPLWILPVTFPGLALGVFWLQFFLQGAWGVLPIYISELSPSGCIATFVGLTYNLGHLFSSAAPILQQRAIELTHYTIYDVDMYQYGLAQAILFGSLAGFIVLLTIFGHEEHGTVLRSVGGAMWDDSKSNSLRSLEDDGSPTDRLGERIR
ncbi:hypothetical protein PGT21_005285 [Puccinia graminis f. sp. tritici]|uniref:Major facilitator superfamily (MFS) profile domain-containing protein n=1 Tax=Puccinia graminis f. sp. tritici TaxID=56615 RepID=A0A5B0PJ42_PUCGR|nr:hypothetical protein PGT21_005285 [Puccinia graminis f. sp. tritici]